TGRARPPRSGSVWSGGEGRGAQVFRGGAQARSGQPLAAARAGGNRRVRQSSPFIVALLALLLSACAGRAVREAPPPGAAATAADIAAQDAREASPGGIPEWGFSGRPAISHGSRGAGGRVGRTP